MDVNYKIIARIDVVQIYFTFPVWMIILLDASNELIFIVFSCNYFKNLNVNSVIMGYIIMS